MDKYKKSILKGHCEKCKQDHMQFRLDRDNYWYCTMCYNVGGQNRMANILHPNRNPLQ